MNDDCCSRWALVCFVAILVVGDISCAVTGDQPPGKPSSKDAGAVRAADGGTAQLRGSAPETSSDAPAASRQLPADVLSSFLGKAALDARAVADEPVAALVRDRVGSVVVGGEIISGATVDGDDIYDIGGPIPNTTIIATVLAGGGVFRPSVEKAIGKKVLVTSALHMTTWRLSAADGDTVTFDVSEAVVLRAIRYQDRGDLILAEDEVSIVGTPEQGWVVSPGPATLVAPTSVKVASSPPPLGLTTATYHGAYAEVVAVEPSSLQGSAQTSSSALTIPMGARLVLDGLIVVSDASPDTSTGMSSQQGLTLKTVVRPLKKIVRRITHAVATAAQVAADAVDEFITVGNRYLAPVSRSVAKLAYLVAGQACNELGGAACEACCVGASVTISKGANEAEPVCDALTGHPEACFVGKWVVVGIGVLIASACVSQCP